MSALGIQVGGEHYKKLKIQPFEYAMANDLGALEHTIVRYVTRWREKGGLEDVKKARHTLDVLTEFWESSPRQILRPHLTAIQPNVYCGMNGLGPVEGAIISGVTRWRNGGGMLMLRRVAEDLDILIRMAETLPGAVAVPHVEVEQPG